MTSPLTRYEPRMSGHDTLIDPDRCKVLVRSGDARAYEHRQCPNRIRPFALRPDNHGQPMEVCGFHAGLFDREDAKHQARLDDDRRNNAALRRAQVMCAALKNIGVDAEPDYHHNLTGSKPGFYTGGITLDEANARKLLEALGR